MTFALRIREFDLSSFDPVSRLLLTSDGTLTQLLEAAALEPISLVKLGERSLDAAEHVDLLAVDAGELLVERKVLLQGARSGKNYVYAESFIAADRLPQSFRHSPSSDTPLGRLWKQHRLEIFKELVDFRRQPAGELHRYFPATLDTTLLVRAYRVFSGGEPVMLIREYFSRNALPAIPWADRAVCERRDPAYPRALGRRHSSERMVACGASIET